MLSVLICRGVRALRPLSRWFSAILVGCALAVLHQVEEFKRVVQGLKGNEDAESLAGKLGLSGARPEPEP